MGASVAIPAVLGAVGLYQSGKQAKAANKTAQKGLKVTERESAAKLEVMDLLKELADKYNPADQTKVAVDAASGVASQTLEKALRAIKGERGPSGPGDSEFHITSQRAATDALDPLKAFTAQMTADEPLRKAEMYQRVLGAPVGNMANDYFQAASLMPRSDPSGSLSILSQALQSWLNKPGGAGGTGDTFGSDASTGFGQSIVRGRL